MDKIGISDNEVGGDIAGRDIDKSSHLHLSGQKFSQMKTLLNKLKEEQVGSKQLTEFIDDLDYFNTPKQNETVIGLDNKLIAGNRTNLIEYAKDVKDRYHRKLYKHQFSEAAQKINLHLLALVQSYYMNEVYPLICENKESTVINALISERIVQPLLSELEDNTLGFSAQDINGMLYFLTGNCHIKWTK
ncbi:ABC-three component system protein [Pedobacter sp. UYP1]|uniref:ABC-three component system protein n=1 Tax=Pedobacter sp. UYP1 TaxID=1756396 RepID=UPI0033997918